MPSHFHHNLGNINKKEPCCNHQSGCDSQKATECELFNTPNNFWVCALKSRYSEQVTIIPLLYCGGLLLY